jgi:hypothetical protein
VVGAESANLSAFGTGAKPAALQRPAAVSTAARVPDLREGEGVVAVGEGEEGGAGEKDLDPLPRTFPSPEWSRHWIRRPSPEPPRH